MFLVEQKCKGAKKVECYYKFFNRCISWYICIPLGFGCLIIAIVIAYFIVTRRLEQIILIVVAVLVILSMKYLPLFFMSATRWFVNSHHKGWVLGTLFLLIFSCLFNLFIIYKEEYSK